MKDEVTTKYVDLFILYAFLIQISRTWKCYVETLKLLKTC